MSSQAETFIEKDSKKVKKQREIFGDNIFPPIRVWYWDLFWSGNWNLDLIIYSKCFHTTYYCELWYCLVVICDDIFYHPWNEYLILKKTTFTLFISRFCHLLSRNKRVKISISFTFLQNKNRIDVYGHIMLKTPVLVRSLKLSNIEPC